MEKTSVLRMLFRQLAHMALGVFQPITPTPLFCQTVAPKCLAAIWVWLQQTNEQAPEI